MNLLFADNTKALMIGVPKDSYGYWLHFNHLYYKEKGGFGLAYSAGEVLTERQMRESLEMTGELLGTFTPPSELSFGVNPDWCDEDRMDYHYLSAPLAFIDYLLSEIQKADCKQEKFVIILIK